ncbi:hypothetical protein HKX48_009185 [Thoreauomyces humboldtii]|nr:hypothetical protein HKX48_009185 [Thoreauomyces humboldtii]
MKRSVFFDLLDKSDRQRFFQNVAAWVNYATLLQNQIGAEAMSLLASFSSAAAAVKSAELMLLQVIGLVRLRSVRRGCDDFHVVARRTTDASALSTNGGVTIESNRHTAPLGKEITKEGLVDMVVTVVTKRQVIK